MKIPIRKNSNGQSIVLNSAIKLFLEVQSNIWLN